MRATIRVVAVPMLCLILANFVVAAPDVTGKIFLATLDPYDAYSFNFRKGNWYLSELMKGETQRTTARPSPRVMRQHIVKQPVGRPPINADRNRWSPMARAVCAAGKNYQFVRDEKDRDLLRELLNREDEDEDFDF